MFGKSLVVAALVALVLLINAALIMTKADAQGQVTVVVKDFQGINPLAGARVVIINAANPADRREYVAGSDGRVTITGIDPAARYVLEVRWRSPRYVQEDDLILRREIGGGDLLRISEIRAHVFNIPIKAVNRQGEDLVGLPHLVEGRVFERFAGIYLDGVELARGEPPQFAPFKAEATLVPQGRHRLQVYWAGYEVYNEEVYIGLDHLRGYVPGLDDPGPYQDELMRLSIVAVTNTEKVTVLVTYMGEGHRAVIHVMDLDGRFIVGLLTLPTPLKLYFNFPMIPLRVEVFYPYVSPWEVLAKAVCTPDPEKVCEIAVPPEKGPFYIVRVKVVSREGYPVRGARPELSGHGERATNAEGISTFYLVRPGTHTLKIFIGDKLAAERRVEVRGSEEIVVPVDVELHPIRVDVQFITIQFKPYEAYWRLESMDGQIVAGSGDKPASRITVESLPPGMYRLWIKLPETGFEYTLNVYYMDLAGDKYALPVGDIKIRFLIDGLIPIPNAEVVLKSDGATFRSRTDAMGEALFENLPLHRMYEVQLAWENGFYSGNLIVPWGGEATANIPSGEIRRPITATVTATVTKTETLRITQTNILTRTVTDEVTRTMTVARTETAIVEKMIFPMVPLMMAAAVAIALIAGSMIVARRWRQ